MKGTQKMKYFEMVYHDALRYVNDNIKKIRSYTYRHSSGCIADDLFGILWENPEVTGTDLNPYCKNPDEAKQFIIENIDEVIFQLEDYGNDETEIYAEIGKAFCKGDWQFIDNAVRHEVLCINDWLIVDMVIDVMKQTYGFDCFETKGE